ncbi:hypothetical protein QO010_001115 [Caulobacter ginsengisoli]|uniref:YbjN domain-containing protein n=1 Tax=Caulobacter ginsengisoli TaxID=400775 RepID=A0ABU0IMV7_9CAUL|nr:hypothetical protein [Caulobacter ginsengisoli]MDQ0463344.1 hypothetical protein [Caulobacter ginsengisoli]
MKNLVLAVVAAATLTLGGAGHAQAAPTYLSDWAPDDMKSILKEVDAKVVDEGKNDEGEPYINAESSAGLKFTIYGTACDVGPTKRCRGAEVSTTYTLESDEAVAAKVKSLDYVAVTIMNDGDKTLNVHRYLIFDYGISRENVKLNLTVFLSIAEKIWDDL